MDGKIVTWFAIEDYFAKLPTSAAHRRLVGCAARWLTGTRGVPFSVAGRYDDLKHAQCTIHNVIVSYHEVMGALGQKVVDFEEVYNVRCTTMCAALDTIFNYKEGLVTCGVKLSVVGRYDDMKHTRVSCSDMKGAGAKGCRFRGGI